MIPRRFAVIAACIVLFHAAPLHGQQGLPKPTAAGLVVTVRDSAGQPVAGAVVTLRDAAAARQPRSNESSVEGLARFADVPPGTYEIAARAGDLQSPAATLRIVAGELREATLVVPLRGAGQIDRRLPAGPASAAEEKSDSQPGLRSGIPATAAGEAGERPGLAPGDKVFVPMPDRWNVSMPDWDRYRVEGDYPYVSRHWWDPYDRNVLKGDTPVIGQRTFFAFTGVVDTLFERRNVPVPAGPSAARPLSDPFFGRGNQLVPVGAYRFSFDLFRGDAAFRPVDWRVRVQPAISTNYLRTEETGVVNVDIREGQHRFDAHAGLQEAYVEAKLADVSVNYDFVSVRAGIQELSTDFRGFVAVVEQPGVRVFGTLRSSRIEYNAAVFDFLEKDTNSGFNEFHRRGQQMAVGNVYIQDFLTPGYTASFSVHHSRDSGGQHYDSNGFLVRPAPIGVFVPHEIRSTYFGWAGNGHMGRLNVSHAFYEALGDDTFNPIAARPISINAQMAAAEVSSDVNWLRWRGGFFWASGDRDVSDSTGRGFDAILDVPAFAGGSTSVWNREGIGLPQTQTGLVSPLSLLPSLRTNKDEGQQNFVNPGILILFGGVNGELTPKLRGFANASFLRFQTTAPLEALLFQAPIRNTIGIDLGVGAEYRPPLSQNIVLAGGAGLLRLGRGMRDIFERDYLGSLFLTLRLQF